jgi:hypothetical protein
MGYCLVDRFFPITRVIFMDTAELELEVKEGPPVGGPDIEMGSLKAAVNRKLQCTGASQGASGQDPASVGLECLAEKVSTLCFGKPKRLCGAAKRRARRAKQAGPPCGEPAGGDTRPSRGGQPQEGGTSLPSGGGGYESAVGPVSGAKSSSASERGLKPTGPSNRQR